MIGARRLVWLFVLALLALMLASAFHVPHVYAQSTDTPTPTDTDTPTPTDTPLPTATDTPTPTPTVTDTPTVTPTGTVVLAGADFGDTYNWLRLLVDFSPFLMVWLAIMFFRRVRRSALRLFVIVGAVGLTSLLFWVTSSASNLLVNGDLASGTDGGAPDNWSANCVSGSSGTAPSWFASLHSRSGIWYWHTASACSGHSTGRIEQAVSLSTGRYTLELEWGCQDSNPQYCPASFGLSDSDNVTVSGSSYSDSGLAPQWEVRTTDVFSVTVAGTYTVTVDGGAVAGSNAFQVNYVDLEYIGALLSDPTSTPTNTATVTHTPTPTAAVLYTAQPCATGVIDTSMVLGSVVNNFNGVSPREVGITVTVASDVVLRVDASSTVNDWSFVGADIHTNPFNTVVWGQTYDFLGSARLYHHYAYDDSIHTGRIYFSVRANGDTAGILRATVTSVGRRACLGTATATIVRTPVPLVNTPVIVNATGIVNFGLTPQATTCPISVGVPYVPGGLVTALPETPTPTPASGFEVCFQAYHIDALEIASYDLAPIFTYLLLAACVIGAIMFILSVRK